MTNPTIQIPLLEDRLDFYKSECRYLKSAELLYPMAKGIFSIPHTFYVENTGPLGHFTAIGMILCYNQLAFVVFPDIIAQGKMPGLDTARFEAFKKARGLFTNSFIVGMNNIRFRKPIDPQQFSGQIEIKEIIAKRNNSLYWLKTSYDFEEGKAIGDIELALVVPA